MKLILQAQSDDGEHRSIWLGEGQEMVVGRTQSADYAFPHDKQMSGRHFAVAVSNSSCRLKDLHSTNGTFVNGQNIQDCDITNGDTIRAGNTNFKVAIEGQVQPETSPDVEGTSRQGSSDATVKEVDQIEGRSTADASMAATGPDTASEAVTIDESPQTAQADTVASERKRSVKIGWLIDHVVLRIVSPEVDHRQIWLRPGTRTTVGRSEYADESISEDRSLADLHFAVECYQNECVLRDLTNSEGTSVNGEGSAEAILAAGDMISAGASEFKVEIQSSPIETSPNAPQFGCEGCPSGILVYDGRRNHPSPMDLIAQLALRFTALAVIDYANIDARHPFRANYLCDWIPPWLQRDLSPVVLCKNDEVDMFGELQTAWGQDAAVCFFSTLDEPSLLDHLRLAARGQSRRSGIPVPDHMFGSCHPSSLSVVLKNAQRDFVQFLFAGVTAILYEVDDGNWEILADEHFAEQLIELGQSPDSGDVANRPV